jgi:hypothetical protein
MNESKSCRDRKRGLIWADLRENATTFELGKRAMAEGVSNG